ncbi:2-keto-4-pentenoate hydratase [Streptomyces sp. UC4497]
MTTHVTPTDEALDAAAQRLTEAAGSGKPTSHVRDLLGPDNIDAAYAVQTRVVNGRVAAGARVVGAKIGLTAPTVQRQFGVDQPDFGVLLDEDTYAHAEEVPLRRFLQPRAEGEIALVLGKDLDQPRPTAADVLRAVDFVLPAIEIADSRIADWDLTITDTIADNASLGAVFLGTTPYSLRDLDLTRIGMTLEQDGEAVSFGAGHACLGSPVAAAVRLARELAAREGGLHAGDIVMTGALGPMVPIGEPTSLRLRLSGLGEVDAVLTGDQS